MALQLTELTITRELDDEGRDTITCHATNGAGAIEIMGMLALAFDTRMWFPVDEDEDE